MGTTTWSGPLRAGTVRQGASANVGLVTLSQSVAVTFTDIATAHATGLILPADSQIVNMYMDASTAWNGTAPSLDIGTSGDPDAYGDAGLAAGRNAATVSAAQAGVIIDIGATDQEVYLVNTGTGASAGAGTFTVVYVQK